MHHLLTLLSSILILKLFFFNQLGLLTHVRYHYFMLIVSLSLFCFSVFIIFRSRTHIFSQTFTIRNILLFILLFSAIFYNPNIIDSPKFNSPRILNLPSDVNLDSNLSFSQWATLLSNPQLSQTLVQKKISVQGLLRYRQENPELIQYKITCCLSDAQLYRIPILYSQPLQDQKWYAVEGYVVSESSRVYLQPYTINPIPTPINPYEYR
jgi:uncharacterized membrane protein YcgQ (UPF0703/DUF1980 family)